MTANLGIVNGVTRSPAVRSSRTLLMPTPPLARFWPGTGASSNGFTPASTAGVAGGTSVPFPYGSELVDVAVNVTTAQAGASVRVGVYGADSTRGFPTGRVLIDQAVSVATTGWKFVTGTSPVLVESDLIWLFVASTTASQTARLLGYNNNSSGAWWLPTGNLGGTNMEKQYEFRIEGRSCADGFPDNPTVSVATAFSMMPAWAYQAR